MMKKCPTCSSNLELITLEENLLASKCSECEGIWISSSNYFDWISRFEQEHNSLELDDSTPIPVLNNKKALLCPDCGRFLRKFKIWPSREFYLDKCGGCNGFWFDKDEWEILKGFGFENQAHLFFSEVWQKKLRTEEIKTRFEVIYEERFGLEDYKKIKAIRNWLITRPKKAEFIAFLIDKDPYKG